MAVSVKVISLKQLSFFYLLNLGFAVYLFRKNFFALDQLRLKSGSLNEEMNLLNDKYAQEKKNNLALKDKIQRYMSLKGIIEEINQSLSLDSVADKLAEIAFSLISRGKGVCILYLMDKETSRLAIFKTKKESRDLIIKAKEGDIFDLWVLRHNSPLIVEDIKNDFRFDPEKLKAQGLHEVSSLISAPLVSSQHFLGILRLDSIQPNFYTQDDLRFLATLCEIGAVAIENGQLFQKTQELAIHDELTGLFTKGYFLERAEEEYRRSQRQDRPFSLLMLDIDFFKKYNDRLGHTAGDEVLRRLGRCLTAALEDAGPIISRFGGEEFCVFLPGADKKKAMRIAEGLRTAIENLKVSLRRQYSSITASVGVASFPQDAREIEELIIRADRAMYAAKQSGRNRVCAE